MNRLPAQPSSAERSSRASQDGRLASALRGFALGGLFDGIVLHQSAVLSHWLLGIPRVRSDVPEPLLWDIGWVVAFGLLPTAVGLMGLRRARRSAAATAQSAE